MDVTSDRSIIGERATLLLIEDDLKIQTLLTSATKSRGYAVLLAATGADGLRAASLRNPAMVILDLDIVGTDGCELIRRLREWYERPIIVLSACDEEAGKIVALDLGADDYIAKPFGVGELLARLRVAERRIASRDGAGGISSRVEVGTVSIDLAARQVRVDATDVHLTPTEYRLLTLLARYQGKVLTHRQILREVWGPAHVESPHYLRVYMRALRREIEPNPMCPCYLVTESGVGYRLASEVPARRSNNSVKPVVRPQASSEDLRPPATVSAILVA